MDGKKKKPIFKKWWFWLIMIVLVLGGLGGSGGTDKEVADTSEPASSTVEAPKEEEKAEQVVERNALIGEAIQFDKVETALLEIETLDKVGSEYFNSTVSDGGIYVAVVWQMKNISDKPIGMFEHPSINLVDDKGTEYSADIEASGNYSVQRNVDNSKVLSDLNPGITVQDTAVFEVSKELFNSSTWKIQFKDGGKKTLVDIN